MTGNRTIKEQQGEKRRGKRRFIERIAEESEADKLIKEYYENGTDGGELGGRDGERPERSKRSEGFLP